MDDSPFFVLSSSNSDGSVEEGNGERRCDENIYGLASSNSSIESAVRGDASAIDPTMMSMDEVLFGEEYSCRGALPSRHLRVHDSDEESCSGGSSSGSITTEREKMMPHWEGKDGSGAKTEGLYVAPAEEPQVHSVDMIRLQSMTCADVRAVLGPFFWRKEQAALRFNKLREQFVLEEVVKADVAWKTNMLERWRRLVNISNWSDGSSARDDVLLPEVLVPPVSSLLGVPGTTWAATSFSGARQLRPHQIDGIRFMWSILAEGPVGKVPAVGCILAHTMGLGKTCQVIIFLHLFLATRGRRQRLRVLIAVPKSTRSGWCGEFATWSRYFPLAQRITPIVIDECNSRKRRAEMYAHWCSEGGVLIVGYEMLLGLTKSVEPTTAAAAGMKKLNTGSDEKGMCVDLLICDEAHRLKSANLQISTMLRGLHPLRRLLLTGTPLQNHLHEYWAMVDFAVHKYFEERRFQKFFINPIEASVDKRATTREVTAARMKTFTLIQELRHFVQRVDSSPLQHELPPLREYVVVVPLSVLQADLYDRLLKLVRLEHSNLNFLQAVTYANKITAHPQLLFTTDPTSSAREILNDGSSDDQDDDDDDDNDDDDDDGDGGEGGDDDGDHDDDHDNSGGSGSGSGSGGGGGGGEEDKETRKKRGVPARMQFGAPRTSASAAMGSYGYVELCRPPDGYMPVPEDGAKLHVAMMIIRAAVLKGEKTLLFSLSTKVLDLFQGIIAEMNSRWLQNGSIPRPINTCRLDGSCSSAEREETLRSFAEANGPDVFLLSMKAGGVGITITSATRVILADSGFNPADDRQAIGRAYRYGQTRPVFVYRLVCYQTLEHRMFEQKLAKEWLFRTVVEEASLKRDALSGLRLQSIFQLLGRAHAVSSGTLTVTEEQRNSTAMILAADPVLADVAANILYVESHEVFLQHDELVQYGAEERVFYEEYQKRRLFNVDVGSRYEVDDGQRRGKRQEEHQQDLTRQTKTLTALVDNIIRSRAEDDPRLRHLLRVMGVTVDADGGVTVAGVQQQQQQQLEQEPARRRDEVKASKVVEKVGSMERGDSLQNPAKALRTETVPRFLSRRLDSSDDESSVAVLLHSSASGGGGGGGGGGVGNLHGAPIVNPSTYEPQRPGCTPQCAILIDEEEV